MNALRLEDGMYLYGKLLYILDSSLAEIQRGKILHRNHRRVIADSLSDKSIPDFEKNPFRFTAPAEASGNLPSKPREPKLCPRFLESAIEILIYRKHVQGLVVLPIFRQITRQVVAGAEVKSRLLVAAELLERRRRGFNGGSGIPSEEAQGSEFDQHPGRCYPVSADPAEHRRADQKLLRPLKLPLIHAKRALQVVHLGEDLGIGDSMMRKHVSRVTEVVFSFPEIPASPEGIGHMSGGKRDQVEGLRHPGIPMDHQSCKRREVKGLLSVFINPFATLVNEKPDERRAPETTAGTLYSLRTFLPRERQKVFKVPRRVSLLVFHPG